MSVYNKKMDTGDLYIGLYISKLDCPWHKTPFPIQGFYIQNQEDINVIKGLCKYVFVDQGRSRSSYELIKTPSEQRQTALSATTPIKLIKNPTKYETTTPFKKELKQASTVYKDLILQTESIAEQLKNNAALNIDSTFATTKQAVASIIRNPDAMIWVTKMRKASSPLYQHSINCTVWATVLGRHIGLSEVKLEALATGTLLFKIGLFIQPFAEDNKSNFIELRDHTSYPQHVALALKYLTQSTNISNDALNTIATHEERHDGSGYPKRLRGNEIPLLGRIAGLADYYETLISDAVNDSPLSPSDALNMLYNERNEHFQKELIENFIQTLGLYPPGTIVRLSTQEIAIVSSNQQTKRLNPDVIVILDKNNQPLKKKREIDLQTYNTTNKNNPITIEECLPFGSYDTNITKPRESSPSFIKRLFG